MIDIDKVNSYRLIQASSEHLRPLLVKRKEDILARMISRYKSGERDFLGEVAELTVLHDLSVQLKQNEAKLTHAEETRANGTTR